MDVETIKIEGSVELAPLLELADAIVDIVETGTTLKGERSRGHRGRSAHLGSRDRQPCERKDEKDSHQKVIAELEKGLEK